MSRLWPQGEPILLVLDRWQRPLRFTWRGQMHQVGAVHQTWHIDTDWWSDEGRIYRHYYALTTTGGLLCVLFQDQLSGEWRLAKIYD
jgi:hypothetical protein